MVLTSLVVLVEGLTIWVICFVFGSLFGVLGLLLALCLGSLLVELMDHMDAWEYSLPIVLSLWPFTPCFLGHTESCSRLTSGFVVEP